MARAWIDDDDARASLLETPLRVPGLRIKIALAAWAVAMLLVVVGLWRYKLTPGARADTPAEWPPGLVALAPPSGAPVLALFAHPRCACTRASVAMFGRLASDVGAHVRAHVVFIEPAGVEPGWRDTDLVERARSIPGVTVSFDHGGRDAQKLGATTSGHVVLYAGDGKLLYSGGVTAARGHEGESPGMREIRRLVAGGSGAGTLGPTFGCGLFAPSEADDRQARAATR